MCLVGSIRQLHLVRYQLDTELVHRCHWQKDRCKGEGGASYNYPVELTCPAETTYTCRGPTGTKYGSEIYPQNCGNPDPPPPHCVGNGPQCVNAYFYPMYDKPESSYAPNSVCPGEQILTITFLSGP